MNNRRHFRIVLVLIIVLLVLFSSVFTNPYTVFASDLPREYNSKMVKAYGDSNYTSKITLYELMMATYGKNTYGNYFKTTGSGDNNWKYTNYWNNPASGSSSRRWSSYDAMKDADVLPKAGDIIIYCDGVNKGINFNGDPISVTHSGVVLTDTNKNGVFYVMEGCYYNTDAVVINKRRISTQYTNYSRMDADDSSVYGGHYKLYAILHNESAEVRNNMVQTAYYEKAKFDSSHSAYRRQIHRDMNYDGYWCVGFVARVALEHPTVGTLQLKASSSSGPVPTSLLAGAKYKIYKDKDCIRQAGPNDSTVLTIDSTGRSAPVDLAPGTYYIAQTKAPKSGLFKLNTDICRVTISKNKTVTFSSGNMIMEMLSESSLIDAMETESRKTGTGFWDVQSSHPYASSIIWARENGIASGYSGLKTGYFGLNEEITRGQAVVFLWRIAGRPAPKGKKQVFTDVPVTNNYYKAIQWAVENGITTGYTNENSGYFGIDDVCTRSQMVSFIWRAAGYPRPKTTTQRFSDIPSTNNFYKPIQWAAENKIIYGYSDGTFKPYNTCTRGQCIYMLHRWFGR